jgi:rhamnosyltransferase
MRRILAVIVTYHPEVPHLNALVDTLLNQVDALVIIDNNTPEFDRKSIRSSSVKIDLIRNENNLGLATAYNQGCLIATQGNFSHIILFDQDSLPAENMVNALYQAMQRANQYHFCAAAAGPKYFDKKGQKLSPFVRINGFHLERVDCAENEIVEIDHLISSGSLIDLRAINQIGQFTDSLFIDCVDTEWCLRARHHGLLVLGVGNAAMQHNIGDAYLTIFNRQLPLHSPMRLYYQFRNQLWIMKQPWVGWRWRVIDGIRCLKLIAVFVFFAPNRIKNLSYILKGIRDGMLSNMGKLDI